MVYAAPRESDQVVFYNLITILLPRRYEVMIIVLLVHSYVLRAELPSYHLARTQVKLTTMGLEIVQVTFPEMRIGVGRRKGRRQGTTVRSD